MKQELLNQLRGFATEDLELTREQGDLIMVETKRGRVMILHNPQTESEFDVLKQAVKFGPYVELLHRGNFVETRDYIASNLFMIGMC
jgi:hypothetical protein